MGSARSAPRLLVPIELAGVVLIALRDPVGDVVRAAVDLAAVACGAAAGAWLAAQAR